MMERYPAVPQVTWDEVLRFIHSRFSKYRLSKVSHEQWDATGHELWDGVNSYVADAEKFVGDIEVVHPTRATISHQHV